MLRVARLVVALTVAAALSALIAGGCGTYKSEFTPVSFGNGFDASFSGDGSGGDAPPPLTMPGYIGPTTCEQALMTRSYIGCDYWPTVTTNPVWSIFDFAVVVANAQVLPTTVTVTGPNDVNQTVTIAAGSLKKIYLPWVPALKGPDCDSCGEVPVFSESVSAPKSAYHLVSSLPVTVHQFNALEYKGVGGPSGKDWSKCPGSAQLCYPPDAGGVSAYIGCYSYTNDASLLIPSTAMTGNYRVAGEHAAKALEGSYFAVTAVTDATHVTVTVSTTATVVGGGAVAATPAGGTLKITMDAGDVVEIMSDMLADASDLSGSLVQADQPVQVIAGTQCTTQPEGAPACDHLESSMLPAETLGDEYVVSVPTSPGGVTVGHIVRFFGNVDGTTIKYSPVQPAGCPTTLNAGQVVECKGVVTSSFEVKGSHEFAVSSFQLGGSVIQEATGLESGDGDPSMSPMVATAEYLSSYIFLAPSDYDQSYIDIAGQPGTTLKLDGTAVTTAPHVLNDKWSITRVKLGAGTDGAHILSASSPVGVQVVGYGAYTSYQYPAGLDLTKISPPPLK